MRLADDEKQMLDGAEGPAVQKAMDLLVRYGDALGAERFVDTDNVTLLTGLFMYPEILKKEVPDLDMDTIASKFFLDSDEVVVVDKVKAYTTTHIFTVNNTYWKNIQRRSPILAELAVLTEAYCRRIGANVTATCSPYLAGNVPVRGQHCAWTESSAIPMANAVLGARTNIEGCHSSFASALTGKTPEWGMHLDENRHGNLVVDVEEQPTNMFEWGLMGYHVASVAGLRIPVYRNVKKPPTMNMLMPLNAAGGSSGSVIMYHIVGITPEAPTFEAATGGRPVADRIVYGKAEQRAAYERLNHSRSESVDIVIFGCPHYSIESISKVARLLDGKKISASTQLYVTTNRQTKALADANGYTDAIHRAGGLVMADTCGLEFKHVASAVIATDSPKQAHYYPGKCGVENVWYGTVEECVEAATSGTWKGALP